jgi:hypothetical protein
MEGGQYSIIQDYNNYNKLKSSNILEINYMLHNFFKNHIITPQMTRELLFYGLRRFINVSTIACYWTLS